MRAFSAQSLLIAVILIFSTNAVAADGEYALAIKNHRFEPAELTVPAGVKFRLIVNNQDSTPEEFESHSLKREKLIPGNTSATLKLGPLKDGRYAFVGEFHEKTARGTLIVK